MTSEHDEKAEYFQKARTDPIEDALKTGKQTEIALEFALKRIKVVVSADGPGTDNKE